MVEVTITDSEALQDAARQMTKAEAEEWRQEAINELRDAGNRLDWNVEPVIQSFSEVRWDASAKAWTFEVRHSAAGFMNFGTDPHIITPDDQESLRFVANGETVFTDKSEHPGMPAISFMQKARERVRGGRAYE